MEPAEAYIDEALDLGQMEMNMLTEGNVEQAEALAADRGRLLDMAWQGRGRVSQEQFMQKMEQMKSMHAQIDAEARRLHKMLKDDLLRTRKKGQGFAGYRGALAASMPGAKFLSMQG
jgi:hypothetical protein